MRPVSRGTTYANPETNGPAPVRYAVGGTMLSAQRARVLEQLQHAVTATTVEETATRMRIHPNTARKHLEALVERGLATRELAAAGGRGRPAWSYSAVAEQPEPGPAGPRLRGAGLRPGGADLQHELRPGG